jgi:hypothetical protein
VFVESTGKREVIEMFRQTWLPLIQEVLKEQRAKDRGHGMLSSATGIQYEKKGDKLVADGYAY